MNKFKLFTLALSTILLLSACQDTKKGKLDNRVLDYWHAKINRDFKTAYQFLSPGWKSNESEEAYIRRMNQVRIKWLGVKINNKKCSQENLCSLIVGISYEYRFKGVGGKKMTVDSSVKENWIMKDNVWYHVPVKQKPLK